MIPFNFHHLYYFYIIAREGSISKAAQFLQISQPALSSQLKQFEKHLEVPLYNREGKSLVLTDKGMMVLSYAKSIFEVGDELKRSLSEGLRTRPHLNIGVMKFLAKQCSSALINFILQANPTAHVLVVEDDLESLIKKMMNHSVDVIISNIPHEGKADRAINNQLVAKFPIYISGHPALIKKYKNLPESLNGAPLLLPAEQSPLCGALQQYIDGNNLKPDIMGQVEDVELLSQLVIAKRALTALNLFTLKSHKSEIQAIGEPLPFEEPIYIISKTRNNPHQLVQEISKKFKLN
jgi:LysR family transcriptional regulator, transcriptional activator of nhaA